MNKIKQLILLALCVVCSTGASANGVELSGICFLFDRDTYTAEVTYKDVKCSGNISIPSMVVYDGLIYTVTGIGDIAFSGCTGLSSVTIPNSVTTIGGGAFSGCTGLTSVTIPNSATKIGEYAFYGCTSLTKITVASGNTVYDSRDNCNAIVETATNTLITGCKNTVIPNSVTDIDSYAFQNCTGLTSIEIPNSVTAINDETFSGCTGLKSVTISESVTSIGIRAFYDCTSLMSVTIPNSVTSIEDATFAGCKSLTSIEIPNSVTSIGDNVFSGFTGLTSVTIPNSVTKIGHSAFYNCTGLTSIDIPNSVTSSIGYCMFYGCKGLTSIEIPNSVTTIESSAFENCTGLTSVIIPNSVTMIGKKAFYNCTELTSIEFSNSITSIGEYAFYNCFALTSIIIPASVTSIGGSAFFNCTGLTSVTIPNSVTSIGDYAFSSCKGLTGIEIPNSVTSIDESAFSSCKGLTSVIIPNSVTSIRTKAFKNCTGLTGVYISDLAAWCNISFEDSESNPLSCAGHLYLNGSEVTELSIPNSITAIKDYTFYGCTGLTSVTIPNSVTKIGSNAFQYCTGLTGVYISDLAAWCNISFKDSSSNPLYYAHHLYLKGSEVTELSIPNSVTSIGSNAFYYCTGLTSVTIPKSVTSIGSYTFYSCTGLTSVTIGNSVTTIGRAAFCGCTGLTSVTIPNSVTSIESNAFNGCTGLTGVTISKSVTTIGAYAFYNCTGLTSIDLFWNDPAECTFGNYMLSSVPSTCTVNIPAETLAAYQASSWWKRFNLVEREQEPVEVTEVTVTLGAKYGTLCSAYALDFSKVDGLKAYTVTAFNSEGVTITALDDAPAETGLLLVADAPGTYTIPVGEGLTYAANLLRGTTEAITLPATDGAYTNFILANGSKGIAFYPASTGTLAAGKAWLPIPTSFVNSMSATRGLALQFEDATTGIDGVATQSQQTEQVYDLQGRRIAQPGKGGVFIVGGKKVLVK